MHVETICPGCQRKLRVDAEHAGKQARCPMCNAIYTVPELAAAVSQDPQDQWKMQTPEGREYGPVTRATLETWITEGRVSDDCKLLCEADGVWQGAGDLYSVLRPVPLAVAVRVPGKGPTELVPEPGPEKTDFRGYLTNPHRGGVILALGILSWAIGCPIFGVVAWVMGSNDLGEMRAGTMDPQGQSLTEAGRWMGMLHTFVALFVVVVGLLIVLFLRFL